MGGPCPLGDSWQFDREEGKWTKLEDCTSPVNDGAMSSVSHSAHTPTITSFLTLPTLQKLEKQCYTKLIIVVCLSDTIGTE